AHSLPGELGHLGQDLSGPTAHLAAADLRDDAVRADRVAAHRDLYPRLDRALALSGQPGGEAALAGRSERLSSHPHAAGPEPVAEMVDRARTESDVHERVLLEDAAALRLGVAASDRDHHSRLTALQRRGVAEVRGEALIGLLADRAGVEDDD